MTTSRPWSATLARTLIHIGNADNGVCSISIAPPRIPERDLREEIVARAKADADLIVRAVNNHDALVSALERIHNWLVCHPIASEEDMAQSFSTMETIARSALSAVKQEA